MLRYTARTGRDRNVGLGQRVFTNVTIIIIITYMHTSNLLQYAYQLNFQCYNALLDLYRRVDAVSYTHLTLPTNREV